MSELQDILAFYQSLEKGGTTKRAAVATIIYTIGPSYRSAGARTIVDDQGIFKGGLSAGCLEGDVACRLDGINKPFIVEYDLSTEDDIRGFPFGCGGKLGVFVEPLPSPRALNAVQWLADLQEPAALLTIVSGPATGARWGYTVSKRLTYETSAANDLLLQPLMPDLAILDELCNEVLSSNKSFLRDLDATTKVFVEYFEPCISTCIFGDAEDAIALSRLASEAGMKVTRITKHDLRAAKGSTDILSNPELFASSYNVVMTHDLTLDRAVVDHLLTCASPYIGVMGPRKRTADLLDKLALENETIDREAILNSPNFYAPVGLDIGAETPAQIALSILAEIQMVARNKTPRNLRDVSGPIHQREVERVKAN